MVPSDAFEMVWKSFLFYALLVALLRIMGKREISSLTAMDLVVFIMLSEAAIISIADKEIPVLIGVLPVLTLAALEMAMAFLSLKFPTFRAVVEGVPAILIDKGRLDADELAKQRMNIHDLQAELRQHNIPGLADVEFAILETSGKLSVVPKPSSRPATSQDVGKAKSPTAGLPVDLIVDGVVNRDGLQMLGHDERWLNEQLGGVKPADVLVATLDSSGKLFVQRLHGQPQIQQTQDGKGSKGK
ncbi:MAG TPA: DUF421 domain-containing protein [Bacillota bacterium]|nr:DUF421 domain-containing protein [Bacillota bacterium]